MDGDAGRGEERRIDRGRRQRLEAAAAANAAALDIGLKTGDVAVGELPVVAELGARKKAVQPRADRACSAERRRRPPQAPRQREGWKRRSLEQIDGRGVEGGAVTPRIAGIEADIEAAPGEDRRAGGARSAAEAEAAMQAKATPAASSGRADLQSALLRRNAERCTARRLSVGRAERRRPRRA